MGEPIKLEDGRTAYGRAQAASMAKDTGTPVMPVTWAQGASGAQPQPFTHPALQDVVISNPPFTEDLRPAYDWTQIRGVHTEISGALNYLGLTSPAKLLARVAEGGKLTDIPGIGAKRAADIVAWCEERL